MLIVCARMTSVQVVDVTIVTVHFRPHLALKTPFVSARKSSMAMAMTMAATPELTDTTTTINANSCHPWCYTRAAPWRVKCKRKNSCGACPECFRTLLNAKINFCLVVNKVCFQGTYLSELYVFFLQL